MELLTILHILRRRWWLIVLLPMVSAVALWLGLRSRPPVYQSSVKLQITTPQREDVAVYEEYRYGSLRDEITVARNNFTEVLQGDDIRNQTASQLGLNEGEKEFPVEVNTVRDADFIYVTVEAGSPILAAEIANTLVDTAIAYYGDLRARPTYAESNLFAEKLRTAEENFRAAQDRFAQFQAENGAVSLEEQLDTYQRLLEQLQLERDRLLLEETTRAIDPISEVDRLIAQHQQELDRLAALAPADNMLQEDVQLARETYRRIGAEQDGGPQGGEGQPAEEISAALEELRAAENALAGFETQQGIVSLESELETYQKLVEQLQLERDRLLLEETARGVDAVSEVEQLIARRQQEMDRLSALVPAYDLLSDDLAQAREQYSYILNKYTEAELTAAAVRAANFIQIVEPAQPPTEPASKAAMLLLLGIAGSVGVGVLLAFLLEYISSAVDDSISFDPADGGLVLGLPILGMVPPMAKNRYRPNSREAEAFLQLRTRLLMSSPGGQLKTLLVTSPQPEDGKTVVAANLCAAMAAGGARVVLVDADLRAPGLHEWFDQSNRLAGLADWLQTEEASLEDLLPELVRDTDIPGLSLVTAGPLPPDPSFLLSSHRMGAVLEILSEHFDRVVLDSPPVVVAPDAVILARLVQSTLIVLSPDRSSRRMAFQAISALTSWEDIHPIGIALNRTPLEPYGYHYYGHLQVQAPKGPEHRSALSLLRRQKASRPISTSQAALMYAVPLATVKRWCRERLLPAVKRGLK
jgi:succinoglycan biosynthesis transport protein ExoP